MPPVLAANVSLHDYTGHAADVTTGNDGSVTITIPRNDNGLGYVCYSRQGIGEAIRVNGRPATQTFFGAIDLDIEPAQSGKSVNVGRIWCAANTPIRLHFRPDTTNWTAATTTTLALHGPGGAVVATQDVSLAAPSKPIEVVATTAGFHQISAFRQ